MELSIGSIKNPDIFLLFRRQPASKFFYHYKIAKTLNTRYCFHALRVVKIRMAKTLLIGLICLVLFMNVANAQTKLLFSDVDVKVGGKSDNNMQTGESISQEAQPEDKIEFKVEVKNNFTLSTDPDIENIAITVRIDGIDGEDGDELEEEATEFDLTPGRDKSKTVSFQLPLEIEDGSYDVTIEAEGEDENGTTHLATMALTLDVDKKRHQLKVYRSTLTPSEVSCNRRGTSYTLGVINIGQEDEEDVIVSVTNSDLNLNSKDTVPELTAEPFEDESKYIRTFTFDVPQDLAAGNYPIAVKASYGSKSETATANLIVNECSKPVSTPPVATPPVQQPEEEEQEDIVEVITPPITTPPLVINPPMTPETQEPEVTVESEGMLGNKFVVGSIIAVEIIAVIAGIALVVYLARKR